MIRRKFISSVSSLRFRLMTFVILVALPGLLTTLYTAFRQRHEAELQAQLDVLRLAQSASVNQTTLVENTRAFLVVLSHMPALRNNDMNACRDVFSHLMTEHYPFYAAFYVADLNGHVVCNALNLHAPDHLSKCTHYNELIKTKDLVISNYHICSATGKAILSMGYPVFNQSDELVLVLNVSIDLAWINKLAAESQLPPGSTLAVIDQAGNILAHYPDPDEFVGKNIAPNTVLADILERDEGTAIGTGLDGVTRLYAVTPLQKEAHTVHVSLGIPTEIAFADANGTLTRNLASLGLIVLFGLIAAWILSDIFLLRQTKSLLETTQRLAAGEMQARTQINYQSGELGQLAQAFDNMAEALGQRERERDRAEESMRSYAANLERSNRDLQDFANITSHDLQEPLRKIQTFGEMLQLRYTDQLDERGKDYLERMQSAAQRMQTLIRELLGYSRINTKGLPFQKVDLSDVARNVMTDLDYLIEKTGARIEIGKLPVVEADPIQMQQLLQNLISNSIKFRKEDIPLVIKISSTSYKPEHVDSSKSIKPAYYEINFTDNGIGFDENYAERIFQPFQRLHARDKFDGTGMGLTICRKIVERHAGSITATGAPGVGATFIIKLPETQPRGETIP